MWHYGVDSDGTVMLIPEENREMCSLVANQRQKTPFKSNIGTKSLEVWGKKNKKIKKISKSTAHYRTDINTPDFWTVWKQNGWVRHEYRQSSHATRWREENIWLPFRANSNLWLCHTWRAVTASALFFNARQWGALMDYGQSPQSLQGSPHTFTTWMFFFCSIQKVLQQRGVFFTHFLPPWWSERQQLNIFCQNPTSLLPRLPANNYHRNYPSGRRRPDEVFLTASRTRIDVSDG